LLAGSGARGCDRDRSRSRLCGGHDVGKLRLRQIFAGDHDIAEPVHQRDRHEILQRVVAELRIQRGVEGDVREPADHQGVAVGFALRRRQRADNGSGAGLVLDEKGLPRSLRQRVGKVPPDEVIAAAGSDRDDDLHGVIGIAGLRTRRCNERCTDQGCRAPNSLHRRSP